MKTETRQIPAEVAGNLVYIKLKETVVGLGHAMIRLEDELDKIQPNKIALTVLVTIVDGKIRMLNQKLALLERISYEGRLDQWLEKMRELTEIALKAVTNLTVFAREAEPEAGEYPALKAKTNWGLEALYRLWGLPLPGDGVDVLPGAMDEVSTPGRLLGF